MLPLLHFELFFPLISFRRFPSKAYPSQSLFRYSRYAFGNHILL